MRDSFIIGTTGRRHIVSGAIPAIIESTRTALDALATTFDESERWREIVVCSGLAVGADSLMAREVVAAREANSASKLRLRAVLPMATEEYERDFNNEEIIEFHKLLDAADEVEILPTERDTEGKLVNRTTQYQMLRDYLLEESDLLVAYWSGSGRAARKPGGTVDVVESYLEAATEERPSRLLEIMTPERLRRKEADGTKRYVDEELAPNRRFGEIVFSIVGKTPEEEDVILMEKLGGKH